MGLIDDAPPVPFSHPYHFHTRTIFTEYIHNRRARMPIFSSRWECFTATTHERRIVTTEFGSRGPSRPSRNIHDRSIQC